MPQLLPKFAQRSGIAVPHGDKVIVTGEDRHLAVADPVADQLGGLGDDVQLIVVDLELGRHSGCMALSIAKGWRLYVVWIALSSSAVGSLSAIQRSRAILV
jgi:hypothetical protein